MRNLFYGLVMLVSLAMMSVGVFLLYAQLTGQPPGALGALLSAAGPKLKLGSAATPMQIPSGQPRKQVTPPSMGGVITVSSPTASPASSGSQLRKIAFQYRNSRARNVVIRIEFEGWKPRPMQRDTGGAWNYVAVDPIPAGDYGYYFVVDNQLIPRDPSNKKTKRIGTNVVSAITVAPPPK